MTKGAVEDAQTQTPFGNDKKVEGRAKRAAAMEEGWL